ncbi:MAG: M20/M25/M40 family metallo-hydrolase [Clostridia bacterium]|nr:M20/M25/M40 family metallo-hydrolase [Clostridia bacterium]
MTTQMQKDFRALCDLCDPSGFEDEVRAYIKARLDELGVASETDVLGNLLVFFEAPGAKATLLFEAHMDEVGFMVRGIGEDGLLRFGCVGGIDPRVLCGKRVVMKGKDGMTLHGVIGSKPIHLQKGEERGRVTPLDALYIDIGAKNKEDALTYIGKGDYGTFDSPFETFGDPVKYKAKAIDDRLGCAVMLYLIERIVKENIKMAHSVVFSFGVREEVGYSGARTATYRVRPTHAIALESTAVADIAGVPDHAKVADQGKGGALSVADNGTIYDQGMIAFAQRVAQKEGIPVQLKRYVSGGNNAKHMQQHVAGCRVLALSVPTRYIHSAACVADGRDLDAIADLSFAMMVNLENEVK